MRLAHDYSQGLLIMVLGGRCQYLIVYLLFVWQDLQDLVIDQMMVCIPFQYIAAFIISPRCVCPGCVIPFDCMHLEWSQPSLQTQVVFSMSLISNPWSITALRLKRCFGVASACWASVISAVVRGYILSSLLWLANTSFMWKQWASVDALLSL